VSGEKWNRKLAAINDFYASLVFYASRRSCVMDVSCPVTDRSQSRTPAESSGRGPLVHTRYAICCCRNCAISFTSAYAGIGRTARLTPPSEAVTQAATLA
jgi:hypothetical protein